MTHIHDVNSATTAGNAIIDSIKTYATTQGKERDAGPEGEVMTSPPHDVILLFARWQHHLQLFVPLT